MAIAHIGTTTDAIQAGLVTMGHTPRISRIKGPSTGTGALLGRNTFATATATAADGLAHAQGILRVALLAGAHIGTDAIPVLAAITTNRHTLLLSRISESLIAETLLRTHTDAVQATLRALGHTELLRTIQFVALLANALVTVTARAIIAANGTGGHTLAQRIEHVIWVAGAQVRRHTKAINALLFAHRITLAQVVRVLGVAVAAQVDDAQRWMGLNV